jgi:hypothetical protein
MADAEHWPDGQPVTPWADPWHDVLGDIRASLRHASAYVLFPVGTHVDDDSPCYHTPLQPVTYEDYPAQRCGAGRLIRRREMFR